VTRRPPVRLARATMKTRLWVWAGVGFAGLLIYLIGYR
jgi:hypothetical protein